MSRRFLFLGICLLAGLPTVRAAKPREMLARHWDTRDGLPQNRVRAMVRSREGFLWLGTDAGLARFDGNDFKIYGLAEGLAAVTVISLLEARDGSLWIGTLGGAVSVMRHEKIVRTYTRKDGLTSDSYPPLAEDGDGRIWVGGSILGTDDRFEPAPNVHGLPRFSLRDKDGRTWFGLSDWTIDRWFHGEWQPGSGGGPKGADAFAEDPGGRLWIADGRGKLWRHDDDGGWESWDMPEKAAGRIASLAIATDGTVWFVIPRTGVAGFRDGEFFEPEVGAGRFLELAESVFATPDGLLWVSTNTDGLYALRDRNVETASVEGDEGAPGADFIGALLEIAPLDFLVGTQGRGIFRWNRGEISRLTLPGPPEAQLYGNAMFRDSVGLAWIGTGGGLVQLPFPLEITGAKTTSMPGGCWDLAPAASGGIWVGSGNGELFRANGAVQQIPYGNASQTAIKGLTETADGALWVGTRGGGLFRLADGESRRFGIADGLGSDVIRVLHTAADGTLLVGTAGAGLAIFCEGKFVTCTSRNGLPDDTVSQIAEDTEGRLWLGTNRGIAVLPSDEAAAVRAGRIGEVHPLVINRADGLVSDECTIVPPVRMADGRFAFATTGGFAMLRPGDFRSDTTIPPVFLETVMANGRNVEIRADGIDLPPGIDRLEFGFIGVDFVAPERLRFRTRLVGLENEWSEPTGQRSLIYRNLAPGTYRFEVSGSIGNGLWSPQSAGMDIVLAPHFWQTVWFKIVAGLALVAAVAAIVRRRERLRTRRKFEEFRREQAVHQERARIARDLHDDVGSSLTQVALLSELADADLFANPAAARDSINEIFTTAKEVTRSLDEIVWAVNPAQDNLERFTAFLGTYVQNYARAAGLAARLELPDQNTALPLGSMVRHHLYLATKEILHNIAKHAGATEVLLHLSTADRVLRLSIRDNGRGLDETQDADGDGLSNLHSRLAQIGGTCRAHPAPGGGTIMEMTVPLDRLAVGSPSAVLPTG